MGTLDDRTLLGLMAAVLWSGYHAYGDKAAGADRALDEAETLLAVIDAREAARREPPPKTQQIVETTSDAQFRRLHEAGRCAESCPICYEEASETP